MYVIRVSGNCGGIVRHCVICYQLKYFPHITVQFVLQHQLQMSELTSKLVTGIVTSQPTGYKFSRCSYVLSLLRPDIIKELDLVVSLYSPPLNTSPPLTTNTGFSYMLVICDS